MPRRNDNKAWFPIILSAKSASALDATTIRVKEYLTTNTHLDLADVAFTLQVGRQAWDHRRVAVCHDLKDVIDTLVTSDTARLLTRDSVEPNAYSVVFMFPGQGAQHVGMAKDLYRSESTFAEQIDKCSKLLRNELGQELRDLLFLENCTTDEISHRLQRTDIAQPALFVIEYALAKLWMSWGVEPQAMIGHSIGEYVAACLAGVFSLEDCLSLVATRARLMQNLPPGAMLAVQLHRRDVEALLSPNVSLAAVNSPAFCVLSGPPSLIDRLQNRLRERKVACQLLRTSHAFHSATVEPILESYARAVERANPGPPTIPFVSNVSGRWITDVEATDPQYWASHMRRAVRFSQGLSTIMRDPKRVLLEVGPGHGLGTFARQNPAYVAEHQVLHSLGHGSGEYSDRQSMMRALAHCWLNGIEINWEALHEGALWRRVPLPTYPFERQRYWIDAGVDSAQHLGFSNARTAADGEKADCREAISLGAKHGLKRANDIANWFYVPSWQRAPLSQPAESKVGEAWLVFVDQCGLTDRLVSALRSRRNHVIEVRQGPRFKKMEGDVIVINPSHAHDYVLLLQTLASYDARPKNIVHSWSVTTQPKTRNRLEGVEETLDLGFFSLIFLTQALGDNGWSEPLRVYVLSSNTQVVTDEDNIFPEKATICGPIRVIPLEYPNIMCRGIDVVIPRGGIRDDSSLIQQLMDELHAEPTNELVALRDCQRWGQAFEPFRLTTSLDQTPRLREHGAYLITGGLGGIGLTLADFLAKQTQARLVLTSRTTFPSRSDWDDWMQSRGMDDNISRKIRKLKEFEACGAEIMIASADVADLQHMTGLVNAAAERFGTIHGVIHSAGIPGEGLIQKKTRNQAQKVLSAKVRGTLVLDALFNDVPLDFFLLCSSQTSILGRFGQVDYCAANCFLDAYATSQRRNVASHAVSVNWDVWAEGGMAVETRIPLALQQWREESLQHGIRFAEGGEVFRRLLATDACQVVVSTRDFRAVVAQHNIDEGERFRKALTRINESKPRHRLSQRSAAYKPARNELEREIAELWKDLLGVEEVGIHDSFLELGGHSLIATMLLSRLRSSFSVDIPLRVFLDNPTISALSDCLQETGADQVAITHTDITPVNREPYRARRRKDGRTYPVVLDELTTTEKAAAQSFAVQSRSDTENMKFSLMFFSATEPRAVTNKYRLLLESARYADTHGFTALWTPERHFDGFGGLYASPSVISAALATITERIELRAGSVILPLQNPIRAAEEWSMVDNLSNGRAAVSFGSGWHVRDFVLAPEFYLNRKQVMYDGIELIRKLWRGEAIRLPNGVGEEVEIRLFPRPLQSELPVWVTCESTDSYVKAGQLGANVLTAMTHQSLDDLSERIRLYREAFAEHGHCTGTGRVTIMQHTYIGEDFDFVRKRGEEAYRSYIRANLQLQASNACGLGVDALSAHHSHADANDIASRGFERLTTDAGLVGTPESCLDQVSRLKHAGVDEIACLIDFLPEVDLVLQGLRHLTALRDQSNLEPE